MKKVCAVIISILILMIVSISCYAYKADNTLVLFLNINDVPSQTSGVDILIQMNKESDEYVSFNNYNDLWGINSVISITEESEIAYYNANGYISYLCHFNNANIGYYQDATEQVVVNVNNLDYFIEQGSFIIAFIDNQGNILSTTNKISVKNSIFKQFESVSVKNYQTKVNYYFNPYYILPLVSLIIAVVTLMLLKLKALKNKNQGDCSVT